MWDQSKYSIFTLFTLIFIFTSSSLGAVIFVDNQLPVDNCQGTYSIANRDCSGSDGDAYIDSQDAADLVEAGDIVYFREGTYYEHNDLADWATVLTIRRSGTPDNPITFKNYNNEEVILSGMRPEMNGHLFTVMLGAMPSIFHDISGQGVQNIIIDGFTLEGADRAGLAIFGPANKNGPAENPTDNIIIRNIIGRNGGNIDTLGRVVNVVIEYCEFYNTGTGIRFNWLSTGFHGPEPEDEMSAAQYCVVRNCLVHDNIDDPPGGTDGIHGAYMYRSTFENNVVWHNSDDGIDMMVSYEGTLKNNIAFNNGVGTGNGCGVKFSARGGGRHTVTGNVVLNNLKLGIEGSQPGTGNQWKTYYPSRIYGNLAYKSGQQGLSLGTGEGYITTFPGFEKTYFMDNLALDNTDDIYGGGPSTHNSNYNFFSQAAELNERQGWGLDAHSLTGDPGIVNKNLVIDTDFGVGWTIHQKLEHIRSQVRAAFSLTSGSQLIDAGIIVDGYHNPDPGEQPGDGKDWYGNAPDIGPYEYGDTCVLYMTAVNGSVTKSPDQSSYSYGETVTLEAVPDTGYHFTGWSGDLSGSDNPTTIIMDSDKSVTTEFEAIPVVVAFVSADSSGSEAVVAVNLTVSLSMASSWNVMVNYSVTGGTATGNGTDYTLAAGTLTFLSGDTTKDISLAVVDDSLDEADETVIVTLNNPTNATLGTNTSHTYTINDNDVTPSVEFTATSSSDVEAVSPATLAVNLSPASGRTVTVDYSVTGGIATGGGVDYTLADGTLTFSPGDTEENIVATIVDDSTQELNETIIVTLSNPTSATLGTNTSHTYTIENDDASRSVEFSTASSSGLESDSPATLVVALLPALPDQSVTVDYSVNAGGTATGGGVDYTLADGSLTFSPGDTEENIVATIVDDSTQELNETIIVTLSNPSANATIGTNGSHTYTIINDDDKTDPDTYGHIPAKDSDQAARDTIIQLHITDAGSGVEYDGGTVTIQIEGDLIYDGANETPEGVYDSTGEEQTVKGICRRVGTDDADYMFVFQSSSPFDYEQKVDVTVKAADKAGNKMLEEYYFYTVMRSFGKNAKVNSDIGPLIQNRPATAVDSAGNIWVVWDQTSDAGDTDIYIGKHGSAFGTSLPVVSDPNNQQNPAIAIDDSNNIYVAWEEINPDDPNSKWNIFASTSGDGINWSPPVHVDPCDFKQGLPAIAIDRATPNKAYIVWEDARNGNKDIWFATSTGGSTWTVKQVTIDTNDQTEPAIAVGVVDTEYIAYIVWTDARELSTNGTDIYGADSGTGPWDNVSLINTASNQSSPVCAASWEVLHLLWVDDADPRGSIFYASVKGTVITDPNVIDEHERAYGQTDPAIAVKGAGASAKVFACWTDARSINSGDVADIYFTESDSGFADRTNIPVSDDLGTNTQTAPVIGVDKDDNPYLVWVDNRLGNNDIYYAGATGVGPPLVTEQVNATDGWTIDVSETVPGVSIPRDALSVDTTITIKKVDNPPPPLPPGWFGDCYDFGPSGLEFNAPVTITIPHHVNDCPGLPIYRAYWYDPLIGGWSPVGGIPANHVEISPTLHAVTFETTHFTYFGVGAIAGGGGGGGGGGGCSVSASGEGNIVEFILPYIGLAVVMTILKMRDIRDRKARNMTAGKC